MPQLYQTTRICGDFVEVIPPSRGVAAAASQPCGIAPIGRDTMRYKTSHLILGGILAVIIGLAAVAFLVT
jgi:hypothetical protein